MIYCPGRKELLQNGADPSYNHDDDDDDDDIIQPNHLCSALVYVNT